MRKAACLLVGVALVALTVPAMAGDIIDMPTGNSVAPRNIELNYIRWDLENPVVRAGSVGLPPRYVDIYEGFFGVVNRVELDVDVADIDNVDTFTEVNLYLTLLEEKPDHPSVIVGATNVLGSDWIDGRDDVSPFVVGAYNINVPASGKPSLNDPLARLQMGWGDKYHQGWFGGIQMMFAPYLGVAVLNYQQQPSYMGTLLLSRHLQFTYGTKNGDPFYRAGGFFTW